MNFKMQFEIMDRRMPLDDAFRTYGANLGAYMAEFFPFIKEPHGRGPADVYTLEIAAFKMREWSFFLAKLKDLKERQEDLTKEQIFHYIKQSIDALERPSEKII